MNAYGLIVMTIVLFSTVEVATKMLGPMDPFWLAFLRYFSSGLVLLPLGWRSLRREGWHVLWGPALMGVLGITVAIGLFHWALLGLPASRGAVIFSLNPLFASLMALFLLREPLTKTRLWGMLLALGGVWLVGYGFAWPHFDTLWGPLAMMASAAAFGAFAALNRSWVRRLGAAAVNSINFLVGSVLLLPGVRSYALPTSRSGWLILLHLCLLATALAFVMYFKGLSRVPVGAGTSLFFLKPLLATLFAAVVLGETLSLSFWLGIFLIFGGLVLTLGWTGTVWRDRAGKK